MTTQDDHPSAIGQRYFYGESCRRNYRKAFPYLLDAALAGDIHSQNLVGYCYNLGLGVAKDLTLAVFWYEQAAKHHHKEALFNLAVLYERGGAVEANPRKAFSLYRRAALLGDAPAQCNLGVCYLAKLVQGLALELTQCGDHSTVQMEALPLWHAA